MQAEASILCTFMNLLYVADNTTYTYILLKQKSLISEICDTHTAFTSKATSSKLILHSKFHRTALLLYHNWNE